MNSPFVLSEPGWFQITNEEHHAQDAITATKLKVFCESEFKYYHSYIKQTPRPKPFSDSFLVGTCLHMELMEPGKAQANIFICFERANTKKYKELVENRYPDIDWDSTLNGGGRFMTHSGQFVYVLNQNKAEMVRGMLLSIQENKRFLDLSAGCYPEISGFAKYKDNWLSCRGDLRSVPSSQDYFIDIKTVASISNVAIQNAMVEYKYPIQAIHYHYTASQIEKRHSYKLFYFLFVEKEYPFETRLMYIDMSSDEWEEGLYLYRELLHNLIEFNKNPRISQETQVQPFHLPSWGLTKIFNLQ